MTKFFFISFISAHSTTAQTETTLSQDLGNTFNISDTALKVARDMETYENSKSRDRATLILEKKVEQEAQKPSMREAGERG